ncbi:MAG: hypothetical protein L6R39_004446 [Caloplaca ligustica]|nr:MAG: hypothetical protein L6R39_004446 [Caloplaca ligustica]
MTAGLVAYFIGLGNTIPEARTRLYDKAYGRLPNGKGVKVPWNGYEPPDTQADAAAPPFPAPSCEPEVSGGFDEAAAITALGDFCTTQTGIISPGSAPISKTYNSGPGRHVGIRLTATWDADDRGPDCPPSQSPNQNEGRDCNTIFHNILNSFMRIRGHTPGLTGLIREKMYLESVCGNKYTCVGPVLAGFLRLSVRHVFIRSNPSFVKKHAGSHWRLWKQ